MKAIVAVSKEWAIGKNGGMLFRLPQDLKFFKDNTLGKVIVMGRKTLESMPNGAPLPGRTNIVVSHNVNFDAKGAQLYTKGIEQVLADILKKYNSADIYIIGGGQIYVKALQYCSEAIVTKVDASDTEADIFFPDLDNAKDWVLEKVMPPVQDGTYTHAVYYYKNNNVKSIALRYM